MKGKHTRALESASTELSEKGLANYPSEVAGWETRQQLCQTWLKQDLRLTASGQSRKLLSLPLSFLLLSKRGLENPSMGGNVP